MSLIPPLGLTHGIRRCSPARDPADRKDIFAKRSLRSRLTVVALTRKRVEDVETLRAFVHPLRLRLLGSLRVDGPATASELGRRFGESSGSTSYHLRQLERYGFVVEDDDQPSKRERRWRAAHDVTSWRTGDFLDDEAGRAAISSLQRQQLQVLADRLQHWFARQHQYSREWIDAAEISDMHLRLRPADLRELSGEVDAVIQRFVERQRPVDDDQAEVVVVQFLTHPETRPQP